MFGADWKEHDVRYEYATEWLNFVRRIWTEDGEFDFQGRWFDSKNVWSEPKPIQSPMPPVMNAGGSEAGQIFAATQADMNFVILKERDIEGGKSQIAHLKNMAKDAGRDVKSWIHVYVVCRETEKEAQDYLNHYVNEKGDLEAVNNLLEIFGMQSETLPNEVLDEFRFHFIAGHAISAGYTPEQIVDEIGKPIEIGVDGMLISWADYMTECKQWINEICRSWSKLDKEHQ